MVSRAHLKGIHTALLYNCRFVYDLGHRQDDYTEGSQQSLTVEPLRWRFAWSEFAGCSRYGSVCYGAF